VTRAPCASASPVRRRYGSPTDELKSTIGGDRLEVVVHEAHQLDTAAGIVRRICAAEPDRDPDTRRLNAPVRDGVAALTDVVRTVHDARIRVEDVGLRRPRLDEAFLHLTCRTADEEAS
jgi:ABC-2 type transport system ATP-binding protein